MEKYVLKAKSFDCNTFLPLDVYLYKIENGRPYFASSLSLEVPPMELPNVNAVSFQHQLQGLPKHTFFSYDMEDYKVVKYDEALAEINLSREHAKMEKLEYVGD